MELSGKYGTAIVYNEYCEQEAISQIIGLISHPAAEDAHVRIMPDVHAGAGCVIGYTARLTSKIIPNLIGVDIGCLDRDTEYLSEFGWKKISEYSGDKVAQYDKNTDTVSFVTPDAYIIKECKEFFHFVAKNGLDMAVSEEHKILAWRGTKGKGYVKEDLIASKFVEHHNSLKKGYQGGIKTTFQLNAEGLHNISEDDIRIIVMISADGTIRQNKDGSKRVELHFRRPRKIERAKKLLSSAGISFNETTGIDGSTYIMFKAKEHYTKDLNIFWMANQEQLRIVATESQYWDGSETKWGKPTFSTTVKSHADLIQFAYAVSGIRVGITASQGKDTWAVQYQCYATSNDIVGFPPRKIQTIPSLDGKKYCFTMPTGYFIARRNDKIFITGNCGVSSWKIGPEHEVGHKFDKLDAFIRKNIPSGKTIREFSPDRDMIASILKDFDVYEDAFYKSLKAVAKSTAQDYDYVHNSLGTLGGGNHFIEVDKDEDGNLWLTIHSGSRNFGLKIATHHQGIAKANIFDAFFEEEKAKIIGKYKGQKDKHYLIEQELKAVHSRAPKVTSGLEYLEGDNAAAYVTDMKVAQLFAQVNRRLMGRTIIEGFYKEQVKDLEFVESVHNYINFEDGIVRKGAISAHAGEKVIIPLNMADGIIIGTGKGDDEWNCSAPHGAGRKMSRSKAKETIALKDFQYVMQKAKVWSSCVGRDTLDESPQAYKKSEDILAAIIPTVDVQNRMFPVYNFKASE